jgi:O2-independent ubiquinone biosynthesis accessory factor UbiT
MLPLPDLRAVLPVLARPLRIVPHPLQRGVLELGLEQLFRASVAEGDLEFLEGRCLAIEIEDAGWRWPIMLLAGRLRVLARDHPADVTIRGESASFLAMAGRLEDPDTLFFQRRLIIQGDTELGLGVKNFLDGLDEERLPRPLRHALSVLRHTRGRLFV